MADPIGTVISSIGKSLVEVLKVKAGFLEGDIVLKSPAEAATAAKVSLFLYQVQENIHFRNREMEALGEGALKPLPLTLDLFYLVTPLAPEIEMALGHLESVMLSFYDQPVLKPPFLTPALVAAGNEAVRITSNPIPLEETSKLWGMFPDKSYRLSATYLLSPVHVPSTRVIPVTRVAEKVTRFSRIGETG